MIDFSMTKSILIPEGEVVMITRGEEVLWQKETRKYEKELAYLESTGTQWIDTGMTINTATDTVELIFQNTESALYKWLFGEYDANARLGLGSGDGANKRNAIYGSKIYKANDSLQYNSAHTFAINSGGAFLDDVQTAPFASFASTSTIYLFNLNIESASNYICKSKIWSYKHTRNGVLVRDFIPVLDLNNVPCMYDKVSGELFYNKGTGDFKYAVLSGDEQNQYIELDYIESTNTQYIDTGVSIKTTHNYELVGAITENTATGWFAGAPVWIGVHKKANTVAVTQNSTGQTYNTVNVGEKFTISLFGNKAYFNGTETNTIAKRNNSTLTLYLFAYHHTDGTGSIRTAGRIYGFKIWDNGELVRDFIPVLDLYNKPCFYDKITKAFFYNIGTGEFKYGEK